MTIQMKATERYFPVLLFIMLYKVILTFESVDEILKWTIQMKAIISTFRLVLSVFLIFRGWKYWKNLSNLYFLWTFTGIQMIMPSARERPVYLRSSPVFNFVKSS